MIDWHRIIEQGWKGERPRVCVQCNHDELMTSHMRKAIKLKSLGCHMAPVA